jgi:hypothetical protein
MKDAREVVMMRKREMINNRASFALFAIIIVATAAADEAATYLQTACALDADQTAVVTAEMDSMLTPWVNTPRRFVLTWLALCDHLSTGKDYVTGVANTHRQLPADKASCCLDHFQEVAEVLHGAAFGSEAANYRYLLPSNK